MGNVVFDYLINLLANATIGNTGFVLPQLYAHLFVSNTYMDQSGFSGDPLLECTAPGYAAVPLTYYTWTVRPSPPYAQCTYPTVTFTMTAPGTPPQTVYGWLIGDHNSGQWCWGNRLLAPYAIPSTQYGYVELNPAFLVNLCGAPANGSPTLATAAPPRKAASRAKGTPPVAS